jgi:hypothetical protein
LVPPRAGKAPGAPIKPPDATVPAGTAQIVLRQDFFNDVLTTIFRDMNKTFVRTVVVDTYGWIIRPGICPLSAAL